MGKPGKRKRIGYHKKKGAAYKTKHPNQPRYFSQNCHDHDHLYALDPNAEPSPSPHNSCSIAPVCNFVGDFNNCECIVHYQDENYTQEVNSDLDSTNFIVIGSSILQCESAEDEEKLLFETLKHAVKRKATFLNGLGFEVMKTTRNVTLIKYYEQRMFSLKLVVEINEHLGVSVTVHGKKVPQSSARILSISDLSSFLELLDTYEICIGNPDAELISTKSSWIEDDVGACYTRTIRASDCELLTLRAIRCNNCSKLRNHLRKKLRRKSQSCTVSLTSHQSNATMTNEQVRHKVTLMEKKCNYLERKNRILELLENKDKQGELLNDNDGQLTHLVEESSSKFDEMFSDPESFQRIFWEEQVKFNQLKGKSGMKWHPLIIKWALLVKSKSTAAYRAKDTGFINLPSERTLYNYSHCVDDKIGFDNGVINLLREEAAHRGMLIEGSHKNYVGILQDEVKIKDDLVYSATSGELVGYTHLDVVSNQLSELQNNKKKKNDRVLATSALVVMISGATTNLKFPLAMVTADSLSGETLYHTLSEVIEILHIDVGLNVLYITCDGAGQNRNLFNLCGNVNDDSGVVYSFTNPCDDSHNIYVISDPPHLMKTVRNCFSNSGSHSKSRRLWNNGKEILWCHVLDLLEEDEHSKKAKLTRAHVNQTSFSRMKVSLATQVFSARVAISMEQLWKERGRFNEVSETVKFIKLMNKAFDCMNTRHICEGKHKRNDNLQPYTDSNDERLTFLQQDLLGYFKKWEINVNQRPGNLSADERARMQLSKQIIEGFNITINSIVECVRFLLGKGAQFVHTSVFNQDPLEQHFGHLRHKRGSGDNPTINEMSMNMIRVCGSFGIAPLSGNTKVVAEHQDELINAILPRRKSKSKKRKFTEM